MVANDGPGLGITESNNVLIGGSSAAARNVISGNTGEGIWSGINNNISIKGNYIGVLVDGTTAAPNGEQGILLQDSSGIIGGSSAGEANIIANSLTSIGDGVNVGQVDAEEVKVSILGNSIYNNGGFGIALDSASNFNDKLDPDSGANDHLNYPSYTGLQESSGDTIIDYLLDVPAGDYRIEFFSNDTQDPSGLGEGQTYLGFQNVTSIGSGAQYYTKTLTGLTGVQNLAMTATEIDESSDGFGATSSFGGEAPPVSETSIVKTLTNPEEIVVGGTANYEIVYTNNGPADADLSSFGTVGGQGLIYDIIPSDLINPSGYIADGPFPGSQVIDVGNPDLTCLYGPPPLASAFGLSSDTTMGFIACWLTGADTTLESGSSISLNISFEVALDSDLVFTNYAWSSSPAGDPDVATLGPAFSSGDIVSYFTGLQVPSNNFAAAAFPLPVEPEPNEPSSSPSSTSNLGSTGQSALTILASALTLIATSGLFVYKKRQA